MQQAAASPLPELPRVCQSSVLHGQLLQRPLPVSTPASNLHLHLNFTVLTVFLFAASLQLGCQRRCGLSGAERVRPRLRPRRPPAAPLEATDSFLWYV